MIFTKSKQCQKVWSVQVSPAQQNPSTLRLTLFCQLAQGKEKRMNLWTAGKKEQHHTIDMTISPLFHRPGVPLLPHYSFPKNNGVNASINQRAKQATLQKAKPSTSTSLAFIPNTSSSSSPSSSSPSSKFKSFLQWIGIVGQGRGGGRNEAAAAAAKERQHMRGGEGVAVHRDLRVGFVVATSPCKDDHGQVERSFEQLVKNHDRSLTCLPIKLGEGLEAQGPFDIIVMHELVQNLDTYIEPAHDIKELEAYLQRHPEVVLVKRLDDVKKLLDRARMYQTLRWIAASHPELEMYSPNCVIINHPPHTSSELPMLRLMLVQARFTYPFIAKPVYAHGNEGSPKYVIVKVEADLKLLSCLSRPILLQEYINHSARVYKVYVMATPFKVTERPSLPNEVLVEQLSPSSPAARDITTDKKKKKRPPTPYRPPRRARRQEGEEEEEEGEEKGEGEGKRNCIHDHHRHDQEEEKQIDKKIEEDDNDDDNDEPPLEPPRLAEFSSKARMAARSPHKHYHHGRFIMTPSWCNEACQVISQAFEDLQVYTFDVIICQKTGKKIVLDIDPFSSPLTQRTHSFPMLVKKMHLLKPQSSSPQQKQQQQQNVPSPSPSPASPPPSSHRHRHPQNHHCPSPTKRTILQKVFGGFFSTAAAGGDDDHHGNKKKKKKDEERTKIVMTRRIKTKREDDRFSPVLPDLEHYSSSTIA